MAFKIIGATTAATLLGLALTTTPAQAISFGQLDDFQQGGTAGWSEGPPSPNPPERVDSGGPGGADDAFLLNRSNGSDQAGGRLIMFNTAQWAGDYISAGVTRIIADVANFGDTTLYLRVALAGGGTSGFASNDDFEIEPDGVWRRVEFSLGETSMSRLFGGLALSDVLRDVSELRLLSARDGPAGIGDIVDASLGIDNIAAVPLPASLWLLVTALAGLTCRTRASQRSRNLC